MPLWAILLMGAVSVFGFLAWLSRHDLMDCPICGYPLGRAGGPCPRCNWPHARVGDVDADEHATASTR